ncbi:ArnT family glycosyltransferase [Candidatus Magnetominusculus dajiuhuensis]|uniref:ArnT family glycosyltransferase n=1 Tax=Candidatus Magnetominusculus dajiuhuensis TaxID=3137712 RepID=UPI003B4295AF
MSSPADIKHIYRAAIGLAVLAFTAFMLFYNLGGRPLWGDEAETALLALNITKYGLPVNTDGKNTITLYGQSVDSNTNHIWTWRPWLGEYLAAASLSLMGKSTTAARLPFAAFGFMSVVALMFVAFRISGDYEKAVLSAIIFAATELFILHTRQGRYYSLIIFGQIWLIYGLYLVLKKDTMHGVWHAAAALSLQFYCNYVVAPGNVIAIGIWAVVIRRRYHRLFYRLSVGALLFVSACLPWLLYARPWQQGGYASGGNFIQGLLVYSKEIHFHIFPFTLLILPTVYHIYHRARGVPVASSETSIEADMGKLFWLFVPIHVFVVSFGPGQNLRYITPLFPVFAIIEAGLLMRYAKPALLRAALMIVLVASNFIPVYSAYPFTGGHHARLTIVDLISEITTPYTNRLEDVVKFLKKEARPDQSVFVFDPEFPLIFYTDMNIIDARLVNSFPADKLPDWVFPVSASGISGKTAIAPSEVIYKYYDAVSIPVHNSNRRGGVPEPDTHEYLTNQEIVQMTVYKRKGMAR